jgi:hypothetical protein
VTNADLRAHPAYRQAIQDAAAIVDRHMRSIVSEAHPRFSTGHAVACFRILRELKSMTGPQKSNTAVQDRS